MVFEVERGRRFLRRKLVDIASSFALIALVIAALVLLFVGERLVTHALGHDLGQVWRYARWPGAACIAIALFSAVYYVTPDVHHRGFRWVTPGAIVGVVGWLAISWGFGQYISSASNVTVLYGAFASAIVLILWLWLTNVCLLFGAELDAEIERAKELNEGIPPAATLALPDKAPG